MTETGETTTTSEHKPLVIVRPAPQRVDRIFSAATLERLQERFDVRLLEDVADEETQFDELLPQAFAVVGQPDLPAERIARAPELRAVLNVEGNFFPNVDYRACHERGIYVLGCGPAYATAVAEYAIGLALDLARGISREDRAFREGRERYVSASTADSILLSGRRGRADRLRQPRAGHPPLAGVVPLPRAGLRPVAARERDRGPGRHSGEPGGAAGRVAVHFVLATVTPESEHLLGAAELSTVRQGARLVLVSRAAVVDYEALLDQVRDGRFLAAVDVWPVEPMPADHEVRGLDGLVLSAHRAGGIPEAFFSIGEMVNDDLTQISRELPPVRMQVASLELVHRYRNRPVT